MDGESFYKRMFWIVAGAAVTTCGSLIVIGVRTSNAQASTNATVLQKLDTAAEGMRELKSAVEKANEKALSLFMEANARVNVLAETVADLRVDMARAGIPMEARQ